MSPKFDSHGLKVKVTNNCTDELVIEFLLPMEKGSLNYSHELVEIVKQEIEGEDLQVKCRPHNYEEPEEAVIEDVSVANSSRDDSTEKVQIQKSKDCENGSI